MEAIIHQFMEAIAENEQNADASFFESHLADDLVFRRVNGNLAGKASFIAGLQGRTWHGLEISEIEINKDEQNHPHVAVATLVVSYDFTIKESGERKTGKAKNIRFLRLEGGVWKVYAWYNEAI